MTVKEISEIIEHVAPKQYAAEWDNVGLMIGSDDADVKKVLLTLDITQDVVSQAIDNDCEMIISHHPLFFKGCKTIVFDTVFGRIVKDLITHNIAVYSCHTNMDAADGGINTALADMFSLEDVSILEPNEKYSKAGIGRIGTAKAPITLKQLCHKAKQFLNTKYVRLISDDAEMEVTKICVASGSCGDLIQLAKSKGCDVIITADVKYHEALEAKEMGIAVIDAGHFPTEFIVIEIFESLLKKYNIQTVRASAEDVYRVI